MADENFTTTTAGVPVASDEHSRTIGPDGPVVLHDVYLVEKLAQFNRERVPERVVHAKGGGAFGTLTITEDVSSHTRAALFHLRDLDMQWDFWTLSPESAHQVTYLMGDRGLPSS